MFFREFLRLREQKELIDEGYVRTLTYELKLMSTEGEVLTAVIDRIVTTKPNSKSILYSIVSNEGLALIMGKLLPVPSNDCENKRMTPT